MNPSGAVFQFQRQRDLALDGLTYAVEATDNLSNGWQVATGTTLSVAATNGTTETVRVTFPVTVRALFVRLRVTR